MLTILYILFCASRKMSFCYLRRNGGYRVPGVSEYQWHCQRMTGWIYWGVTGVIFPCVWPQMPLSLWLLSEIIHGYQCLYSPCSPFPMQALLVQLPSQHFLVPSARQVAISVVPCVLCWSWALAVSPSPPSRLLLHMLYTWSSDTLSLDPSQILSSFLRLSPENHAIMSSSSSFL